jgi:hypothetical protein
VIAQANAEAEGNSTLPLIDAGDQDELLKSLGL